jgi:hypothetical protein
MAFLGMVQFVLALLSLQFLGSVGATPANDWTSLKSQNVLPRRAPPSNDQYLLGVGRADITG